MELIIWFQNNWGELTKLIVGLIGVATIITRLTPTLSDDTILLKVIKFISRYISLNDSRNHEEKRE